MRVLMLVLAWLPTFAAATYPDYKVAENISVRRAVVLSGGVPLVAHVLQAKTHAGKRLPTVVICQGTGGLQHFHLYPAAAFANAGFTVITFDYRGWGESAGRLVLADPKAPGRRDGRPFDAGVLEVRETVDPLDQAEDVQTMLHWAADEPEVDAARLGLWGTSLGATVALQAALNDARVRALVAQVGMYDMRAGGARLDEYRREASRRARGELPYAGPRPRIPGQLHGQRIGEKFTHAAPGADLARLAARPGAQGPALLVLDAENEDLFDIRQHGERLHERYPGPKERLVLPGIKHYDIYRGEPLQRATRLAVEWFERHLK
jgi:dienelactone hydrolase